MPLTTGTSHFVSRQAAVKYYRAYEGNRATAAVAMKLAEGEIHIGEPILNPGETLSIIDGGTRYAVTEAPPSTKARQIIDAINAGLDADGDNEEWEAPEFQAARDLTKSLGCVWDFSTWSDTRRTVQSRGKLGGVVLTAPRAAIEPGTRVEAGTPGTEDYDTGKVVKLIDADKELVSVAWDSGVRTSIALTDLRVIAPRGPESAKGGK